MTAILKPSIPPCVTTLEPGVGKVVAALKENVEIITGVRNGAPKLTQLPSSASLAQVISTLNTVIQRLNQTGQ